MYWFSILEILEKKKGQKLDVFEIANELIKKGETINFNRLRKVLLNLYLKNSNVDRIIQKEGFKHKYLYFFKQKHINTKRL